MPRTATLQHITSQTGYKFLLETGTRPKHSLQTRLQTRYAAIAANWLWLSADILYVFRSFFCGLKSGLTWLLIRFYDTELVVRSVNPEMKSLGLLQFVKVKSI